MTCVKCDSETNFYDALNFTGKVRNESVTVEMPGYQCPSCGHQAIEGSQMAEFMVKSADAYRQKHQLLLSSEIKRARERVKMSQREFASYLGVGPASVKRWELGEIQTRLADQIIRLKTDPAYAESSIAEVYSRVVVGDMEHASAKGALSERRGHVRGSTDSGNVCETLAA